ncbi:MAG: hypothetical protein WAT20_12385 [Ferruginibacter sp.]|nr:hypothetical protein [Chitinophagaceae bacterium]
MHYRKPVLAALLLIFTSLFACNSSEIGESKDVNQDKIYMDYHIAYTEGDDQVALNFQYRFAGAAGTTLVLNNPSQVILDGEILKVDSSKYGGAFYTVNKNHHTFLGKHNIQFTDINGKHFENSFVFAPFTLVNLPATADRNKDLVVSFTINGLNAADDIEINSVDTDSSFHYHQSGTNTSATIPALDLKRQKNADVSFEATIYRKIPLTQTTAEGGTLQLTYRLKPVKIKLQP